MDMVDTLIVPQAADPRVETRPRPEQKCELVQEINDSEDNRRNQKIYQFQNCGAVYMDSHNAHGVRIENCGNIVPQFTCSLSFPLILFSSNSAKSYFSDHCPRIVDNEKALYSQSHAVSNGMWAPCAIRH
jgi:hypothetical protein